jgi:carboxypeptidase C (cathepsin A)
MVFSILFLEVAVDFYAALNVMYNSGAGCFKDLGITGDNDLFIFGESYAGKYVPAIAEKIVSEKAKGGFLTGLRGVGIGDGFTDPYHILAEVGNFAYNIGLIDFQERAKIEGLLINATFQNRGRRYSELHDSFEVILDHIVTWSGGVNVYDFTKYHEYPSNY